jgi:hypothetical protein
MLMETKCHMFSVGINSAFDQSMEKVLYNIKFNTLLLLLLFSDYHDRYTKPNKIKHGQFSKIVCIGFFMFLLQ